MRSAGARRLIVGAAALAAALFLPASAGAASPVRVVRDMGDVKANDPGWPLHQDVAWLAAKWQHRVVRGTDGVVRVLPPPPRDRAHAEVMPDAKTLASGIAAKILEPEGSGVDDSWPRKAYSDRNYWGFCAAGAAAVSLFYIGLSLGMAGTFHEPYGPHVSYTHWERNDVDANGYQTYARAMIVYLAEATQPPSFNRPGIDDFDTYPTSGGSPQAIRDAINWEASDEGLAPGWQTFFYATQANTGSRFSQAQLNADIVADVAKSNVPAIMAVDADFLPNWPDLPKALHHAISVVGYDNIAGTYTYLDTCGKDCGSDSNGGLHVIPQWKLFKAVQMVGKVDDNGQTIVKADGTPKYPIGAYIW